MKTELIFVTNITNYICGEKNIMWRNFREIWEILEIFWEILGNFEKFWEILGNLATSYTLSFGEKLSPKSTFVEKNGKYE